MTFIYVFLFFEEGIFISFVCIFYLLDEEVPEKNHPSFLSKHDRRFGSCHLVDLGKMCKQLSPFTLTRQMQVSTVEKVSEIIIYHVIN